jgi:hypothetical protein
MIELLKHNYMRGTGHGKDWQVYIDPPKRKVKSFYEESVEAIEYIYANKTGKFQVLYSGGVDGQYVIELLRQLKMPYDVTIIHIKDGEGRLLNGHEIVYAHEYCKSRNITPNIYDLNFTEFVESGRMLEIAQSVTCCSIALPGTMHVSSQLDGFKILGNDPAYLKDINGVWTVEELEYSHGLLRFFERNQINGVPFFLQYTAEMELAFLLDPAVKDLVDRVDPSRKGSNSIKSIVFNRGSDFNIPVYDTATSKKKYTGYEKIYNSDFAKQHPNLVIYNELRAKWNGEWYIPYHDLIEKLSVNQ